jgi:ribosomal protein L30
MAKLRITYTKSAIGYSKDQKNTIRSLGLRKLNSTVVQNDTPPIRGMLFKVRHLVSFEEVADDTAVPAPARAKTTIVRPPVANEAPKAETPAPRQARSRQTVVLSSEELPEVLAQEQESENTPAASKAASRKTMVLSEADAPPAPKAAKPDDLEVIEGIGPKIAGLLQDAGITSFAELAATSVARLEEILEEAKLNLASPETWPEQAALAAADDWDALKSLQDQLKGGRKE